jgi:hypothetical protein
MAVFADWGWCTCGCGLGRGGDSFKPLNADPELEPWFCASKVGLNE